MSRPLSRRGRAFRLRQLLQLPGALRSRRLRPLFGDAITNTEIDRGPHHRQRVECSGAVDCLLYALLFSNLLLNAGAVKLVGLNRTDRRRVWILFHGTAAEAQEEG